MTWVVDRSRIEAWEKCPRFRYLHYHHGGRGLARESASIELVTGREVHDILDLLARGADLEAVLESSRRRFLDLAAGRNLSVPEHEARDLALVVQEQIDLIEALVRAHETAFWPRFQQSYDLLSSEQELEMTLDDVGLFLARPDRIVRRRSDGALLLVNYKTVGQADHTWTRQWLFDQQIISEVEAVRRTYQEDVFGAIVVGLLKGRRSEYKSYWSHNNKLVWCWYWEDEFGHCEQHADYEWTCSSPHARCPGGRSHRLGPGYAKRLVSQVHPGGVKRWVAEHPDLAATYILELPAVVADSYRTTNWLEQIEAQEYDIKCRIIETPSGKLNQAFPMHTAGGNCLRPRTCQFFDICWGSAGACPGDSGYQWRVPNHPKEKLLLGEPGREPIPSILKGNHEE